MNLKLKKMRKVPSFAFAYKGLPVLDAGRWIHLQTESRHIKAQPGRRQTKYCVYLRARRC